MTAETARHWSFRSKAAGEEFHAMADSAAVALFPGRNSRREGRFRSRNPHPAGIALRTALPASRTSRHASRRIGRRRALPARLPVPRGDNPAADSGARDNPHAGAPEVAAPAPYWPVAAARADSITSEEATRTVPSRPSPARRAIWSSWPTRWHLRSGRSSPKGRTLRKRRRCGSASRTTFRGLRPGRSASTASGFRATVSR